MERPETGKSYFYIFNFLPYAHEFSNWNVTGVDAQYEPDNWAKAVNSTNFRKAFLYAINPSVTLAVTAPEGYDNYKLHTITPPSFCANSQGVDYTECGDLANLSDFFDEAKAKEYRDAAVEELTAAGATFPIKVQYPYNPAVVDWDKQCQVLVPMSSCPTTGVPTTPTPRPRCTPSIRKPATAAPAMRSCAPAWRTASSPVRQPSTS